MGNRAARRRVALLLLVCAAVASACQTLYGVDTPRRSLQKPDSFEVEPQCPDLTIDSASLVATLRVITLTGRRWQTGLGAESVPVTVNIGPCEGATVDAGTDA